MRLRYGSLLVAGLLASASAALPAYAQDATQKPSTKIPSAPPASEKQAKDDAAKKVREAEVELQRALAEAGNDRAALVHKLEEYLQKFPDAPRRVGVYRALVEAATQLRDYPRAIEYAERLVANDPGDTEMMLLAVGLLEQQGDEHSLTKAIGYASRVLDRIEKTPASEKPARVSPADWELSQKQMRTAVYLMRGRLEMERRDYAAAQKDLEFSYHLLPNAPAAEQMGELAELRKDCQAAIGHFATAFVVQETIPGATVDRREVRQKLGNCWRQVHGSDAGLGEAILAAYDRLGADAKSPEADARVARNKDAKDPYAFVLRRLDGTLLPLVPLKGKIIVMSFWATWCLPCRELEPRFDQVAQSFAGKPDVAFFAVNTDEDETRVPTYLARQKIASPVVFADGLDRILEVRSLPTVVVLDRAGKIVYRTDGYLPDGFVEGLITAVAQALQPAN